MLKPEFMSDESDPSVREWQRIMAARAQGHDLSADEADVARLETAPSGMFVTKDSGERVEYPSGMRRDVDTGKPRYDLIPRRMLRRLAELYARGAVKYGDDNWQLADSEEEWHRFQASAFRHFMQWLDGEVDEDHGAAVFFNIAAAEHVRAKLDNRRALEDIYRVCGQ